ncbi:MAG: SOS response-associated peptidase [Bradymonadia bacterium]
MCGRYFADFTVDELKAVFKGPDLLGDFEPSYNVAPTDSMPIVRLEDGAAALAGARWGLVPSWAEDTRVGYRGLNARAETVHRTRMFRDAFTSSRCLVLASGFYEWLPPRQRGEGKQPYAFSLSSGKRLLAFAGLWARRGETDTFTIVTTEANGLVGQVHERMPVILAPRRWRDWISAETPTSELHRLLGPCPDGFLTAHPVDDAVGNVRARGPELMTPIGPELQVPPQQGA